MSIASTRAEKPDIKSLSFVRDYLTTSLKKGQTRKTFRCFWVVSPTGDYQDDCVQGEQMALEWLLYAKKCAKRGLAADGGLLLVVKDMPPRIGGVEVGFFSIVGFAAAYGAWAGEALAKHFEHIRAGRPSSSRYATAILPDPVVAHRRVSL